MTYSFVIPRWHPTLLNKLLAGRWKASRLKKMDAEMVRAYASWSIPRVAVFRSERPRRTGTGKPTVGRMLAGTGPRRRVSLRLVFGPGERRGDEDGYWKSVLDALVKCGLLVNDSPTWMEKGTVIMERRPDYADRLTEIILEDLP